MSYFYELNQLSAAINGMAVSPKSIQERVGQAYVDHLAAIEAASLPESLQHSFRSLRNRLTAGETVQTEKEVLAIATKINIEEAVFIALTITHMLMTVKRLCSQF